ncbi:hypothetical protein ABPG74_011594 [Tetrahymena malaccensis]
MSNDDTGVQNIDDQDSKRFGYDYQYANVSKDNRSCQFLYYNTNKLKYSSEPRKITSGRPDENLPNNKIKTNKYTCFNFVPKNLYLQFSKLANVYFLFIGIMQSIPQISISNAIPVIFLPLAVIVAITGGKDLYEDYKRMKSDRTENDQKIQVFDNKTNSFKQFTWKEIRPGHIVKVMKDHYFPADVVLLMTSDSQGVCYIETKNLDGETNLESKQAEPRIRDKCIKDESKLGQECVIIHYESPNKRIYHFDGSLETKTGENLPLNYTNVVLRGCCLKNTEYAIGMALYTGHQSKIMYNLYQGSAKKSTLEQLIGKLIIQIFLLQLVVCIICASIYIGFYSLVGYELVYLVIKPSSDVYEDANAINFFVRLGNWILIFTNFVPISLIVTLETVKFIQGMFMTADEKMGNPTVQASNLNEQLGQINYIFSDKTGTLTKNIMQFKQIAIGDTLYGGNEQKSDQPLTDEEIMLNYPKVENVDFRDRSFLDKVKDEEDPEHQKILRVLFMLASCHTVTSTIDHQQNTIYTASSPDEYAIINFTKFAGVEFLKVEKVDGNTNILIRFKQKLYSLQLLHVFEFDSNRKRQSVIVKDQDDKYFLFCKGADQVITMNLSENTDPIMLRNLNEKLKYFGSQGLRTLMLAERQIDKQAYEIWSEKYLKARSQTENKELEIEKLQDEMETELEILGATAIEDKLQDDVADTIKALKDSGIKIWVLTGDKIETAINIAYSCKLLDDTLEKAIIDVEEENEVNKFLQDTLQNLLEAEATYIQQQRQNKKAIDEDALKNHALVISGFALNHISKTEIKTLIMKIVKYCKCIICCRVSPKQKQEVVTTVREMEKNATTLAIGDGANDVNMITAAHVGIGIEGVEGQQAARASDYSINQFKELRRLLFYHGRECYRRNSNLVLYNFYKNVLLVLPQFWYGWTNWFSGQTLYNSFIYQLFNIFFASLPIMVYAIWDEEYSDVVLMKNEKKNYYEQGIKNKLFNQREFWMWNLIASVQAGLIVICSLFPLELNFVTQNGQTQWFWATGTMVFGLVVVISNLKILIMSTDHSLGSLMILALSMLLYLITWVIVSNLNSTEIYRTLGQMFQTPNFHLGNILCIIVTAFFDWAFCLYRKWTYEFDEKQQVTKIDKTPKQVKTNSTFPIKMRTFNTDVPKKQNGFVKDQTKANYATQEMKRTYYQDVNTGYAFNQIDRHQYVQKQKEQQMF